MAALTTSPSPPADAGSGDAAVAGRGLSALLFVHVAIGLAQQGGGVGGRGTDGLRGADADGGGE
jgi:hypothetical protein